MPSRRLSIVEEQLDSEDQINFDEEYYLRRSIFEEERDQIVEIAQAGIFKESGSLLPLTKTEMNELARYLAKIERLFDLSTILFLIPAEMERSIRRREVDQWLPWETEAIEKVDTWRADLAERQQNAQKMLREALDAIRDRRELSADLGTSTQPSAQPYATLSGTNHTFWQRLTANRSHRAGREHDVAISFVPGDSVLADEIEECLRSKGLTVLLAGVEEEDLSEVGLGEHLGKVYWSARLCLILEPPRHRKSEWWQFETQLIVRRAAQDPTYAVMVVKTDDESAADGAPSIPTVGMRLTPDEMCVHVEAAVRALPEPSFTQSRFGETRVVRVISRQGSWAVKLDDAERATRLFDAKRQAVEFSHSLRERNPDLQIVIHNTDGTVQERVPESL